MSAGRLMADIQSNQPFFCDMSILHPRDSFEPVDTVIVYHLFDNLLLGKDLTHLQTKILYYSQFFTIAQKYRKCHVNRMDIVTFHRQ